MSAQPTTQTTATPTTPTNGANGATPPTPTPKPTPKASAATRLIELAQREAIYFHSPDGRECARITENGMSRIERLRSDAFRTWLQKSYYQATGSGAGTKIVEETLNTLCGIARFDGIEMPLAVRVAEYGGNLYIDLGDSSRNAIEVTPDYWGFTNAPPVAFWRPPGMAALPIPEQGSTWDGLFDLVNVSAADGSDLLLKSWIVGAFHPTGPYPILALYGGQGSAKSFTTRIVRALIDPNNSPLRAAPKDLQDLGIAAQNSHILTLDNVSDIPAWLSDGLCRMATGGGNGTRKLYSNDEEISLEAKRPVILNGITEVIYRGDLLERTIILHLPEVSPSARRSERELNQKFDELAPGVMGCICDALSAALANWGNVELDRKPRMSDFTEWIAAAAPAFGLPGEMVVQAFFDNQAEAAQNLLFDDELTLALLSLLPRPGKWSGNATQLLGALRIHGYTDAPTARSLSTRLARLAPLLPRIGLNVSEGARTANSRSMTLERTTP